MVDNHLYLHHLYFKLNVSTIFMELTREFINIHFGSQSMSMIKDVNRYISQGV